MIYLDNAATSAFKPDEVLAAFNSAVKFFPANPGRGAYPEAIKSASLLYSARKNVADFFNFPTPERVIFTSGCTHALNLAILGENLIGKHVITTTNEHNSVLRPLFELKRRGEITLTVVAPSNNGEITLSDIAPALRPQTRMVVTTHVSNVTGAVTKIDEIGAFCRSNRLLYLVDAAQSAGYVPIDIRKSNIDFLALPAHKGLHALPGVGALLVGERVTLRPIIFGGTGINSDKFYLSGQYPEDFEPGTLNLPAIAALSKAVTLAKRDFSARINKISALTERLRNGLNALEKVRIYSPPNTLGSITAFNVASLSSEEVADRLAQEGICLRCGLHCAPLVHKMLGTLSRGVVRASLSFDNEFSDVDDLLSALKKLL